MQSGGMRCEVDAGEAMGEPVRRVTRWQAAPHGMAGSSPARGDVTGTLENRIAVAGQCPAAIEKRLRRVHGLQCVRTARANDSGAR
jgi:hypothetical protein